MNDLFYLFIFTFFWEHLNVKGNYTHAPDANQIQNTTMERGRSNRIRNTTTTERGSSPINCFKFHESSTDYLFLVMHLRTLQYDRCGCEGLLDPEEERNPTCKYYYVWAFVHVWLSPNMPINQIQCSWSQFHPHKKNSIGKLANTHYSFANIVLSS